MELAALFNSISRINMCCIKVLITIWRELKSKAIIQIVLSAGPQFVVIISIEP